MLCQSFFTSSRLPRWLSLRESPKEDPGAGLRKCIERAFLYRGSPLVQAKTVILSKDHTAAYIEFTARPLYQEDSRLKYKLWGQLFIEQTFDDTAKVLWTVWTRIPTLDSVTLKVFRCPSPTAESEEAIVLLRARSKLLKDKILNSGKASPTALLQHCEIHCEPDPRVGLRTLKEE
jgi:hypothetical protein